MCVASHVLHLRYVGGNVNSLTRGRVCVGGGGAQQVLR